MQLNNGLVFERFASEKPLETSNWLGNADLAKQPFQRFTTILDGNFTSLFLALLRTVISYDYTNRTDPTKFVIRTIRTVKRSTLLLDCYTPTNRTIVDSAKILKSKWNFNWRLRWRLRCLNLEFQFESSQFWSFSIRYRIRVEEKIHSEWRSTSSCPKKCTTVWTFWKQTEN